MDLTIALNVLLKIAFSFPFKHHILFPCSIADLTQQRQTLLFILRGNVCPSNNSPLSLTLTLAVTVASQPPLQFSLSHK